jgi:hypothetical protein
MFGSPPQNRELHNVPWIQKHWDSKKKKAKRITRGDLTDRYKDNLRWFFYTSDRTGCIFQLGIIATLKHTEDVGVGHMDHIIRQTLVMGEELQKQFPNANVLFEACNEVDAHHHRQTPFGKESIRAWDVEMWAYRRARDEYWEDGILTVTHGGRDDIKYPVGRGPQTYDAVFIHPARGGRDWTKPPNMSILRRHGLPVGNPESMYFVTHPDTISWYRNPAGLNTDLKKQLSFYAWWEEVWDYALFHADWLMQSDHTWLHSNTIRYIDAVAEMFKGGSVEPPAHDFMDIVERNYQEILHRRPDPNGAAFYHEKLRKFYEDGDLTGMSESAMRDNMLFDRAKGAK